MREYKKISINDINPKDYVYFAIALMTLRIHNWECSSITNGELKVSRFVEGSDDFYDFASEEKKDWTENDDVKFWSAIDHIVPPKKQ